MDKTPDRWADTLWIKTISLFISLRRFVAEEVHALAVVQRRACGA